MTQPTPRLSPKPAITLEAFANDTPHLLAFLQQFSAANPGHAVEDLLAQLELAHANPLAMSLLYQSLVGTK